MHSLNHLVYYLTSLHTARPRISPCVNLVRVSPTKESKNTTRFLFLAFQKEWNLYIGNVTDNTIPKNLCTLTYRPTESLPFQGPGGVGGWVVEGGRNGG